MDHNKMINISTKRGFLWPSFEIYSGVSGFTDYGPLGAILKNNVMDLWRRQYIVEEGFFEIETPTVTPEEVLKASGHVDNFTDPMTKCEKCGDVFRADHLIEELTSIDADGFENEKIDKIIAEENLGCLSCEGSLTKVWNYNLMFPTTIGAKGQKTGYMRPETAQGIFIPFKRLSRFFKDKLPFGVVQLGKSYRNEISPRQGVIRLREFTQAEAEIFVNPKDKTHIKFKEIANENLILSPSYIQEKGEDSIIITAQEALDNNIVSSEILIYQLYLARKFLKELGIPDDVLRFRQHLPTEMAHYAIDCWDVECYSDQYGWVEIIGIADRGDYDLKSHSKHSNEELTIYIPYDEPKTINKKVAKVNMGKIGPVFKKDAGAVISYLENCDVELVENDIKTANKHIATIDGNKFEIVSEHIEFSEIEETISGERIYPHVIEPSFGIDRIIYSILLHSFKVGVKKETTDDDAESETKDYFKLANKIAPIKVSVFPLMNKEPLKDLAKQIEEDLRKDGYIADYDSSGTIGKRYARSDEIGVPIAITVDFESLEDNSVTFRNRDSEEQKRIPISKINEIVKNDLSC